MALMVIGWLLNFVFFPWTTGIDVFPFGELVVMYGFVTKPYLESWQFVKGDKCGKEIDVA